MSEGNELQESYEFSLTFKEIPIKVGSTDYVLREMDGAMRDRYLTDLDTKVKKDPTTGKPVGLKTFEGFEANLIRRCLFHKETNKPEEDKVIQGWPGSIKTKLFDLAQKINALDEKAQEQAKNG